jgi:hypothetical protein
MHGGGPPNLIHVEKEAMKEKYALYRVDEPF